MSLNDIDALLHRVAECQAGNAAVIKQAKIVSGKCWRMSQVVGDTSRLRVQK